MKTQCPPEHVSGPERGCSFLGTPYQASRGDLSLTFHLVSDPAERERTFALRHRVYQGAYEYLLRSSEGLSPGEDEYDSSSLLFCCRQGEEVVATCRFTPKLGNGWEVTELCTIPALPGEDLDRLLQVSRVVVHPELRRHRISEIMMYFCCHWFVQEAQFSSYFAVCLPPLVRFYRHFGVQVFSPEELTLPGRGDNRYFLVHGSFLDSLWALRGYLADSWQLSPDIELSQATRPGGTA
jgi:predicted GNAT family N-acyltransferase